LNGFLLHLGLPRKVNRYLTSLLRRLVWIQPVDPQAGHGNQGDDKADGKNYDHVDFSRSSAA